MVTTSRADWTSLGMVTLALREEGHEVPIVAIAGSGDAHDALMMSIEADGLKADIAKSADLRLDHESPSLGNAAAKCLSLASEALWCVSPDLVFLGGDRWETAQVASAAALAGIRIAHLGGGDKTVGSVDDKLRWVITALSDYHFATTSAAGLQLSLREAPGEKFVTGSPAIDRIMQTDLGPPPADKPIVVNWQPETAANQPNAGLIAILEALDGIYDRKIFMTVNPDRGATQANELIRRAGHVPQAVTPTTYLSMLKYSRFLIGNSSSGYYEAPALGARVIDVGDRQKGRITSRAITNCRAEKRDIISAIRNGRSFVPLTIEEHPYGDGHACERIVQVLDGDLV